MPSCLALLRRFKGASMRIVVTGAAGFIGSNIIQGLNQRGITNIIAVDDLRDGDKFRNLADLHIADYQDAGDFYARFAKGDFGSVEAVFHEGACSDTMETNGQYMMHNNYQLSCDLFAACQRLGTRLLYASSAATYGGSASFVERPEFEKPLNVYGYSKLLFDQRMRRECGADFSKAAQQVCGFRYFNVYGPREQHKGRMASSSMPMVGCACLVNTAATAPASSCATLSGWVMWSQSICGSSTTPKPAACSTWAPGGRKASTKWRWPWCKA